MFAHMESLIWQVSFKVYICGLKLFSKQYFSRVNTLNYLVLNAKAILFYQHSFVIRQESFSSQWLFGAAKEKQWICVKKRIASKYFFTVFGLKEQFGQLMICEDFNLLIRCVETSCNTDRKRFARVCRKQWSMPPFNIANSQWWRPYWTTRTLHSVIIITGRHERHFYGLENLHGGGERTLVKAIKGKKDFFNIFLVWLYLCCLFSSGFIRVWVVYSP